MSAWDFPSYKFGKAPEGPVPDKKERVEAIKADPKSLPAREVKYDKFDANRIMTEVANLRRDIENMKHAQKETIDENFKKEVIGFFNFLMESIERVSGGKFPSRAQIIDEMKKRFLR